MEFKPFVPEVSEYCPECDSEIVETWDVLTQGYRMFCIYCGKEVMCCDACLHADDNPMRVCDWDSKTNMCFRRR